MSEDQDKSAAAAVDESEIPTTPEADTKDTKSKKAGSGKSSGKAAQDAGVKVAEDKAEIAGMVKTARKKADGELILVPVDFSAPSKEALLFAAELAQMTSATLMVLHVVHDPGDMPGYYAGLLKKKRVDRIQDIAKEVFNDFMADIAKEHHKLKALRHAENMMVIGLPVTRILQVAEKLEPFMVVMGSQGRTGLKHLFLGSKAEQIVQLCPVPVTIVKQKQ
ncbi:MAG: universal stress protein [Sedimenticolaceae bacterium]|jgi:nucleotide-binding universal stress UspA family protein